MSLYQEVSTNITRSRVEQETARFWEENRTFQKSVEELEGHPSYVFYDGPPTANGKPHIGHLQTRSFKDLFPRFHTMKGQMVPRKAGWDTHGLPVELEVEKLLHINGKDQIEAYGIAPLSRSARRACGSTRACGRTSPRTWASGPTWTTPTSPTTTPLSKASGGALKQIWDKGLLYKGFKIVPYCPRCGTPLSSHEVAQGYKDVKERSAIAKFKVKGEDAFILAWTTTPWTLPSNVALCVNANEDYVKVSAKGETYYLAAALCDTVLGEGEYTVLETYKGADLEGKEYEPLFDFVSPKEKCWYVVCDDYVTLTDGTGIVHIAPAFGEDDAKVGRKYGLPLVQLVDGKGEMTAETKWAGTFCKDADPLILQDLEERGLLFSAPKFEHSYPFCWRCDTPLIYYARESWYIKMTDVKDQLIANNNTVKWYPESIGKGRFGDWLENVQDWAVSRNRYWGTPLNIWECECGHRHAVGSIAELRELSSNCPEDIELHRPYVDQVTIPCPHCGKEMHRVPEVIDCWFDSGSMPFAQHHYPFENKELFESQFPADFISEAVDQTRGWFYSLLAISTLLFDKAPFKNVLVQGLVQDENGQKMSKSKGNAVDPMEALKKFGADPLRWYFYTNSAPWLPSRFHEKAVIEGQKKFFSTLWNTYAFYVLYANIDSFDPTQYQLDQCALTVMDRWLLSRLNTAVQAVDENLSAYKVPEACRALQDFVDEMSNWYVRRSRERYWAQGVTDDKTAAYMTLYTALVTTAKMAAPMAPFMSEDIYRNLVCSVDKAAPESVHLCAWPQYEAARVDKKLEADMDEVLRIVTQGRAARNLCGQKNRQPLQALYTDADAGLGELYQDIIKQELNVKELHFLSDMSQFTDYTFKPQLKLLGKKLGKRLGEVRQALSELDGSAAKKELDDTGVLKLALPDGEVDLTAEELLIDTAQKEGFTSISDRGLTVVLDTTLNDQLIEEGFVREIVSKLQSMRKDAGFNVVDHIEVYHQGSQKIAQVLRDNEQSILSDVLGEACHQDQLDGYTAQWDINGETTTFGVKKL